MTITRLLVLWLAVQSGTPAPRHAWVLDYHGRSTNDLDWDRLRPLVNTRVPAKLSALLFRALGGPPEPVIVKDNRYVSMAACVPHGCPTKGFFWFDVRTGVGLGAVASTWSFEPHSLRIGSNGILSTRIPTAAREALIDWLTENEVTPERVEFVARNGEVSPLDASNFQPRPRRTPPVGGPSFDCAQTFGPVQRAICGDRDLSALDLKLFQLVEKIRRGHSTLDARNQLLELQSAWITRRDSECAAVPTVKSCLEAKYSEQWDRLMNWLPQ